MSAWSFGVDRLTNSSFLVIAGIEIAAYFFEAGRTVLDRMAGDDGQGPWKTQEKDGIVTGACEC
jgi:hypothetical protein